jgi:hypothetical protein
MERGITLLRGCHLQYLTGCATTRLAVGVHYYYGFAIATITQQRTIPLVYLTAIVATVLHSRLFAA